MLSLSRNFDYIFALNSAFIQSFIKWFCWLDHFRWICSYRWVSIYRLVVGRCHRYCYLLNLQWSRWLLFAIRLAHITVGNARFRFWESPSQLWRGTEYVVRVLAEGGNLIFHWITSPYLNVSSLSRPSQIGVEIFAYDRQGIVARNLWIGTLILSLRCRSSLTLCIFSWRYCPWANSSCIVARVFLSAGCEVWLV